jgi:predicted Zn-dependent peptidase
MEIFNHPQFKLYYVYQDHFSVHDFGAVHRMPYSLSSISPLAMTRRMMKNVNAKYPTNELMQSYRQKLYGLNWTSSTILENDTLITFFSATSVRGDWLKQTNLDEAMILHVLDSIYLPWFNHPDFLSKDNVFEEEKTFNLYRLKQLQATTSERVFLQLRTMFPETSPYIADLRGDYEGMTVFKNNHLQPFYKQWIQYPIDFYYVGPLPLAQVAQVIAAYPHFIPSTQSINMPLTVIANEPLQSKSSQGTQAQTHLVQIYTTGISRLSKDSYAIRLLNHLLGVGSESILFQELREKYQFCYAVSSEYTLNDGTLEIRVGLAQKNLAKAKSIISETLQNIREGKLDLETFQIAKQQLLDSILRKQDTVDYKYSVLMNTLVLGIPYDESMTYRQYETITIDDVYRVAHLIQPHRELVYLGTEQ